MNRDFITIRDERHRQSTIIRDWRCGLCGSKLAQRPVMNEEEGRCDWTIVCVKYPNDHHKDDFIHDAIWWQRVREGQVHDQLAQIARREYDFMLKDRMKEGTSIPKRTRLPRIGRIRLGHQRTPTEDDKRRFTNDPFFRIDPAAENPEHYAQVLADTLTGINELSPGQDPDEIHILPIVFLADDPNIFAPASYKQRKGRRGTVWCAGDGDTIQWKLTDDFRQEILGGFKYGTEEKVSCPGNSEKDRHPWCKDCKPELELNFAIVGAESSGAWMMRTGDMQFHDELWSQLNIAQGLVENGIVPHLGTVPFEMTRHMGQRMVKITGGEKPDGAGDKMTDKKMPVMSIQIHPVWLRVKMAEHRAKDYHLGPPEEQKALPQPSGDDDDVVDFVVPPDSFLMEVPAGKNKGKTLGWLLENEPVFLQKIADEAQDEELRTAAEQVINYLPF